MNIADITFAWFNTCKGGKAGEKGGGKRAYKSEGHSSYWLEWRKGGRKEAWRMALCGN